MSCGSVGNIKIEPVNVSWQIEEQWMVKCLADVASSLNNKYFKIRNGLDAKFHVWFNVNSAGSDPAPSGSTAIEVPLAIGATAETIATAIAAALSGSFASKQIQDILYTAKVPGTGGNSITITYVDDGTAGAETIGVSGNAITVHMEDGVSTAQQIATAVTGDTGAMALLGSVAVDSGDEDDPQAAVGSTPLTGGGTASTHFVADSDGDEVHITAAVAGDCTDWEDSDTGFTLTQCQDGGDFDLGLLDGNVEPKFEEKLLEIMAHQNGSTPLADLRQGVGVEVAMTLKECDAEHLKAIFSRASGGTDTPSAGTEVFGWGKSRLGQSTLPQARRLILHPVVLADDVLTRDLCFWKAYPIPDSLVFSGEDPQTLGVTFKCYLDDDKPDAISMFGVGDWSQYVPVAP